MAAAPRLCMIMRILLAEDDKQLNDSISCQLLDAGFTVDCCFDGEEALFYAQMNIYDVVLMDRMLPYLEGTDVIREMRKNHNPTPVIVITALGTLADKITGLDQGADDYLVKPFAFEELLARIRCVTRRPPVFMPNNSLTLYDLHFQPAEDRLSGPKGSCSLSKREAALMEAFIRSPGQILQRSSLLLKIWGPDSEVEDGNLDNYIHFLRRRLLAVGSSMQLKTVRGIGYCLQNTGTPDSLKES